MVIDKLISEIKKKKNPCIVGIDPDLCKIPTCYKLNATLNTVAIEEWALDVIDAVKDIVPAIKPQVAFFEVYGAEGIQVYQRIIQYAHELGLIVIDDSKRGDIGNTAKAYAFAHLANDGPINADFLTVSPFLGTDSLQPFVDMCIQDKKGLFILVKTSNPSSTEISEATNRHGETILDWLAGYISKKAMDFKGQYGYSPVGAVVGATFPDEAKHLRKIMKNNFFLVPGYGAQGATAKDIIDCFNEDGLGAIISSSRSILYHYLKEEGYDGTRESYKKIVGRQAAVMQKEVYGELMSVFTNMTY